MDMTSYLLGKKSSGGGSSNNVVFVNVSNEGVLDIKPSDVIDTNGKFKDKLFILKVANSEYETLFVQLVVLDIEEDDVTMVFGTLETMNEFIFVSTISGDEYFTTYSNNAPIPNPLS